jgi:hypothetical protein
VGCFLVVVTGVEVVAYAAALPASMRERSEVVSRRSDIYRTPWGLAACEEASEIAGAGSFGETGCVCMYLS